MRHSFPVEAARPEEREPALRLVFGHLPPRLRDTRVANAQTLIAQGELDPRGILVARGPDGLVGGMVAMRLPGASGLVWPPQAEPSPFRAAVEDGLVRHAAAWLRREGAKLGQALLVPEEASLAAPLERNGFRHVTSLWYLRHHLGPEPAPQTGPALTFDPYPRCDPGLFEETLLRTYEGTRDCPELNGVRTRGEIMAGHRAQGQHAPELWWLAREGGRPAGVLLLTRMTDWGALDVSYLGVVPEARRRGVGRALARLALEAGRRAGAGLVTLAVDRRNQPAWDLYISLGFEPHEEREVYLALWGPR